jgi:hypothetical protein
MATADGQWVGTGTREYAANATWAALVSRIALPVRIL